MDSNTFVLNLLVFWNYCLQLSDTETRDGEKNDVISKKLHFHFLCE